MSKASSDLTGRRFGKWTVMGRSDRPYYWRCRCDCGTEKDVYYNSLLSGNSSGCNSCSCRHARPEASRRNLDAAQAKVGQTINGWKVLEILPEKRGTYLCCKAICPKCGRPSDVMLSRLPIINRSATCNRDIGRKTDTVHAVTYVDGSSLSSIRSRAGGHVNTNSATGANGVSRMASGHYRAYINFRRKQYNLGSYGTLDEAIAARKEAEALIYAPYLKEHEGWEAELAEKLASLGADKK